MPGFDIQISAEACEYLRELLAKQEDDIIGVRMFVENPGTSRAETCIAYCREQDKLDDDVEQRCDGFILWRDKRSEKFLQEAEIDFEKNQFGGQLTIKAPNAKTPKVGPDSPLEDHINYTLHTEINPALAAHGGEVSLVELIDDEKGAGPVAVLRFGGGCQGCGMVDVTLKDGVEKTLMERLPQLKGVRDVTDHSDRSQAYY